MKVFKRHGSRFFTYKFQHKGKEYYRSTGTANRRDAEDIAAAARRSIIRQLAGLEEQSLRSLARSQRVCQLFANSNPLLMPGWLRPRTNNREQ
jgi:hypothetical protein